MKELLSKLIKNNVDISFKSGDKMKDAVIEAVIKNVLVVTYNGGLALVEIPHIAHVTTEAGVVEVMQSILSSDESKDSSKDDKKKKHH